MKKVLWLLLLGTSLLFAEGIRWESDYNAAVSRAKQLDKPILFVFSNHACKWCRHLEATTFKDSKVIAELNEKFVSVMAYGDGGDFVPRALWAPGTPALWFLDERGEAMFQPIQGAVSASDFLQAVNIVLNEYRKRRLNRQYGNKKP